MVQANADTSPTTGGYLSPCLVNGSVDQDGAVPDGLMMLERLVNRGTRLSWQNYGAIIFHAGRWR
jgi:hypothetical protein